MRIEEFLIRSERVSWLDVAEAVNLQRESRPALGELAVRDGSMRPRDVEVVLRWQRFDRFSPFGAIALDLGYLSTGQLTRLLDLQQHSARSLIDILCEMRAINAEEAAELEAQYQLRTSLVPPRGEEDELIG